MSFVDAIIYVENFPELVGYLDTHAPSTLARDEDNNLVMPPNVIAFARTPAVVNGDKLLAYCRFTDDQATQWRDTPYVEVLSEVPYHGRGTGDMVYSALFADPDATAKYDAVYDRTPREYTDEETGETYTVKRPDWFGMMAGG